MVAKQPSPVRKSQHLFLILETLSKRKAITYGKLVDGIDVCKFGKQWVVSMQAMRREYGEPRV